MFDFFKKQSKPAQTEAVQAVKEQLPEGCELLADCDFAEVSGGWYVEANRPINL